MLNLAHAQASGGYKLNKSQFIGRVSITRTGNPELIDQTSREGLKDCDEKTVFVELLRFVIQDRMRKFLDDVEKRHAPKHRLLAQWLTAPFRVLAAR